MSGFAGAFMRTGEPPDRAAIAAMAALTPYRAADCEWTIHSGGFSAIRQLTRTTTEDACEKEPVRDPLTGAVLLFDGRLDNRDEVARALRMDDDELRAQPDARIVLEAWNAWGNETPARLLGDFSWVLWDPSRAEVVCARDPMGIRPLFYYLSDRAFVFASELRQVLAHPLVPREPDEAMAAAVLQSSLRAPDRTLYRDVKRLPHAHYLRVSADRVVAKRYWKADLSRALRLRDDREYADAFRDVFDRAVSARVRSAGALGAYLSGGLDSSSVLASARLATSQPLTAFTLVFPHDPAADERAYSDALLQHSGLPGVRLQPAGIDPRQLVAAVIETGDLPPPPNDLAGDAVLRAMAERGIRVALTGCGGDYGLTGSLFHIAELLGRGRIAAAVRRGRDALSDPDVGLGDLKLIHHAVWPLLPKRVRRLLRPVARRMDRRPCAAWIPRAFAKRAGLIDPHPARELPISQLARVHALDAYESPWNHALDDMYHRGSAAWQVEERHPFFDRRVIEFALALPDDQRWKHGWMKYVLRGAMTGRLPERVRLRPDASKADFSKLFEDAITAIGGEAFFDRLRIAEAGWIEPGVLKHLYRRMQQQRQAGDRSYGDTARDLWAVASLELWYTATFEVTQRGSTTTWMTSLTARRQPPPRPAAAASHISARC